MMPRKWILLTTAPLLCASLVSAQELMTVSKEEVRADPSDSEAVVYFVRPAMMGKAVRTWLFVDDAVVGVNRGKHYTFAKVPAGRHLFWAKAENVSALELEVEAGATYFLKQKIKMGGMKARVKLQQLDTAEGEKELEKCNKYTSLTPEGERRGAEIVAEKHGVAVEKAARRSGD